MKNGEELKKVKAPEGHSTGNQYDHRHIGTHKSSHRRLSHQLNSEQNPKESVSSLVREKEGITQKSVTESYNFDYRLGLTDQERQIVNLIDSSELELTPKEIAFKTGINHNTVRVLVRRLLKGNFILNPHRGFYSSRHNLVTFDTRPGGRVTSVVPRLHNIRLKIENVCKVALVDRFDYGVASVSVVVGENGVANVQVDCFPGVSLDYTTFRLLTSCLLRDLNVPKNCPIYVTSFELNHDFTGLNLSGCQSLTLSAFDGSFERLYNKRKNLLRSEVKAVGPTSPEAVYELLKGGVSGYNSLQYITMLINEIREYTNAQKFTNRILSELLNKLRDR